MSRGEKRNERPELRFPRFMMKQEHPRERAERSDGGSPEQRPLRDPAALPYRQALIDPIKGKPDCVHCGERNDPAQNQRQGLRYDLWHTGILPRGGSAVPKQLDNPLSGAPVPIWVDRPGHRSPRR